MTSSEVPATFDPEEGCSIITPSESDSIPMDIGVLLKNGTLNSLTQNNKLKLLNHTPDINFNYPTTFLNGCNRRFKPEWIKSHSWLHYSASEDGVYCKACALFAPREIKRQKLGALVTKYFSLWTKQSTDFNSHEELSYHQHSMAKMAAFKESCHNPTRNIATMLNNAHKDRVSRNTQVVKSLLKCVAFCGKQGLSFRGHRDDSTASNSDNTGNFVQLVQFRAENDDILRTYLETAPRNALYMSKTIQNEMISMIGSAIQDAVIEEIHAAKFFTILADEVTDCANLEQVSIVIRYVDSEKRIREEFLGFVTVERITCKALAAALLSWLKEHNINVSFCRDQGYDGASNMSSGTVGVQALIREVSPLAFYTHCHSHQLNLCIVKACSLPQIRNTGGLISEIAKCFNSSPKRQKFFERVIEVEAPNGSKNKLKNLCRTRWVQRIDSYTAFYDLYPSVIKTMEAIDTHSSDFGDWSWDTDTLVKARGFLHQLLSFEFVVAFNITMRILSSLRSLTVKLQKKSNDVLAVYELVSNVQLDLALLKSNCEEEFHLWFNEMTTLADKLNISVSIPRIASRQVHRYRSNAPADSPESYYRQNIMIPFLDHITMELEERFGPIHQNKVKLLGLIPSVASTYPIASISEVGDLYSADLPSPHLLTTEFSRWKRACTSTPVEKRPDTLENALLFYDKDDYPNIFVLLLIACTLPVTTCETERSNSQLKLLKTYLRSSMTEKRLSSLALIKIHRDMVANLDFDKLVVDCQSTSQKNDFKLCF